MNRTYFLDINQTMSTGHVAQNLAASVQYYRDLGLDIPDGIQIWPDLFQLPEVLRRHEPLPSALAGALWLSSVGEVAYATVRASDVELITKEWLARHGFPSAERVIMCQSMAQRAKALLKEQVSNIQQLCRSRLRTARRTAQTLHRGLRRKGEEKEAEQKKLYEKLVETTEQMVRLGETASSVSPLHCVHIHGVGAWDDPPVANWRLAGVWWHKGRLHPDTRVATHTLRLLDTPAQSSFFFCVWRSCTR